MPAVARAKDEVTTGHGCDAKTKISPPTTGVSAKVYANEIAVACLGDAIDPHQMPNPALIPPCIACINPLFILKGSSTVSVGGVPIARVGDSADLGAISKGSPDVNAGG